MKLLLLILLISFTVAKRPKQVLKSIGKRYQDRVLEPNTQFKLPSFGRKLANEEDRQARAKNVGYIGGIIKTQSSDKNWLWFRGEWALEKLMDEGFEGSICGSTNLNYVQFIDYMKRQRVQYTKNDDDEVYTSILNPDSIDGSVRFLASFTQHSTWGFTSNATYMVDVVPKSSKHADDINIYVITGVQDVGSCTEYGKVDWKLADSTSLRVKDGDSEEQQKVQKYLEELFEVGVAIDTIPFEWLPKVAAKHEFFDGQVCHDGVLKPYTKYKLIRWWKKFQLMWHPVQNQTNHTEIQLLGGGKGRYVFRVTMDLQLGAKKDAQVQKVNFKLQIQYNVHGDELWYINKFEVMCPLFSEKKLMEIHAGVIKEVIGARMQKMIDNPEMWYACTHVFDDLISLDTVEFESCTGLEGQAMEKIDRLNELEHKFWEANKEKNGRMEGYDLGGHRETSEVAEKMWVQIFAIWTPLSENTVHESRWTFNLQWNTDLQIFEIVKITFACPQTGKGNKWYSSLRTYP